MNALVGEQLLYVMVYVMNENQRCYALPSLTYYAAVRKGYQDTGLNEDYDIPEIINNSHTQEDCYNLLEQINDLEWHGLGPMLPEGILALELCKRGNSSLL